MQLFPAAAILAAVVVLTAITTMLARSEPYLLPQRPKPLGRHELAAVAKPYRPRPWDEVEADEETMPITDAMVLLDEAEPIDELDPRWDWQAYLAEQDTDERELVPA